MPAEPEVPVRRPPPPIVEVTVTQVKEVNPSLMRVELTGDGLADMETPGPAASVRLLVPSVPGGELVMPEWNGNEFLLPDDERPVIRTFTPLRFDPGLGSLTLEIVRHRGGAVSTWAESCAFGDPAGLSGPGAPWEPGADIEELLVFGDETAIPAIGQVLEHAAAMTPKPKCLVHIEVTDGSARRDLGEGPGAEITWHVADPGRPAMSEVVDAAEAIAEVDAGTHVWAAGEAAGVQKMRKHFQRGLGLLRDRASIRGYWKSR